MVARPPARNPTKKNHIGRDVVFFIPFFYFCRKARSIYTKQPTQMTQHSDAEIQTVLQRNPNEGFAMLVERFQEPLYWHIRRLVVGHHDSEDITQEAFVRIFRGLPHFKGHSSLTTWVYRIATNEALRWLKRNEHKKTALLEGTHATQEPHINYEDIEAITLQRAIASLPRKQQLIFNLCYYDELDYEQVAAIVGGRPSAAKANYHLAKKSIKEQLLAKLT